MEQRILEIVNIVLENRSKTKVSSLSPNDKLRDTLGFDSLDLAELTVRIEDEFGVDVFEDGLVNTVGEIYSKLG
ncbi:acyl carrier protein [Parabacteroides goldsteinii]|jgi:acyl carrier protein|uniref:acyl carrier protein n=1 Tax=Parabacteroides goldsteinii TaxID=328812 RepID=UPI001897B5F2|nr:acyl carrier protein [Parabacteroides goldsteinii]UBD75543.1 acyl carrier protein [Parabacteroides goldsteinii]